VRFAELTPPEQRVLGCLIEKRWTTPDAYPLSLNALRLACNQSTNRDPVPTYDEDTKYRHLAEEGLGLTREPLAVLAVLLLRGPQTPGELKTRTERLAPLATLADVERVLEQLQERDFVRRIGRRPGQKEDRFQQLLGDAGAEPVVAAPAQSAAAPPDPGPAAPEPPAVEPPAAPPVADPALEQRVAALEDEVARLRRELDELLG
jgi:uncharacterized protein